MYLTIYRHLKSSGNSVIAVAIIMLLSLGAGAQTATQNYIKTRTPNKEIKTNVKLEALSSVKDSVQTTIQYFDGLSRPLQTVQRQASPASKDVVQPFIYDQFGREATKYLPYATSVTGDGSYKTDALTPGFGVAKFYYPTSSTAAQQTNGIPNTLFPFAQTAFEASPLNRVIEQGAPGAAWQLGNTPGAGSSSNTSRIVYTTNSDTAFNTAISNNKGSRKVILYRVVINGNQSRTLNRGVGAATEFYAPGQLSVTISRDENWKPTDGCFGTTEEYKDKEGHVIVKRTYNLKKTRNPATGAQSLAAEMLSTYYIYDALGNLCLVLPPGAYPDAIVSAPTQDNLDNLCYQYRYDERNRLVQKRIPAKGWEYIIYNKLDQPIATQDSMQRRISGGQQWTITKYDAMGRVVLTGIYQPTGTTLGADYHASLQAIADTTSAQWETPVSTGNGYTANTWPKTWTTTLSVNYYDSYTNVLPTYNQSSNPGYSKQITGLLTGTKTLVLGTNDYLWTVFYYNDDGNVKREVRQHYVGGSAVLNPYNFDEILTSYNFLKQPTSVYRYHYLRNAAGTTGTLTMTEVNLYSYDHMGRKRVTDHRLRDGNESASLQATVRLSVNDYNEVGQLKTKHLHSIDGTSFLQNIDYRYNPRGWLSSINNANLASDTGKTNSDLNDLFGEELKYDDATTATQQYNGNIATVKWKSGAYNIGGTPKTPDKQTYDYTYDNLNRLRAAVSTTTTPKDGFYDENAEYDNMGNIKFLNRYDKTSDGKRTVIDSLNYKVYSNYRITRIDDTASYAGLAGFQDLKKTNNEYSYDGNGNLTKDQNKDIASISYNMLNLPQVITKNDGSTVVYIYNAAGNKLRKIFTASGNVTTTEYDNGIQYNNSTTAIDFIQTEEGRARKSGSKYVYEYDLKDHLGNTRVTITPDTTDSTQQTAKILQESDYYAFGYGIQSLQPTSSPKNEYLYNHKELQEETGLYDYGARFYDPVIGRWTSIDPLAEASKNLSVYNYGNNNPIKNIDPDGKEVLLGQGKYGGDLYTGADAQNMFRGLQQQQQNQQDKKDKDKKQKDIYIHNKDGSVARYPDGVLKLRPDVRTKLQKELDRIAIIEQLAGFATMLKSGYESFFPKKPVVDEEEQQLSGGAARAQQYSSGWGNASLEDAISKFAPDAEAVQNGQKVLYTNDKTGVQVVYDEAGNYFRIQDTKLTGRRPYLDMEGNIPNNKVVNGRTTGRSQAEYNQATHFNNSDN